MSTVSIFAGEDPLSSPNDPLVSVADFTELFSIDAPTTADTNRIQTALEISSAAIRNGRRLFDAVTDETVVGNGTGRPTFFLPGNRLPVRAVTQVEEKREWDTDFVVVDPVSYDWDADGLLRLNGKAYLCWTTRMSGVRVKYSHGYLDLPREVAGIALSYGKRIYDDPAQFPVLMERLGDYQVQYEPGGGLLAPEKELLRQYEVVHQVTV